MVFSLGFLLDRVGLDLGWCVGLGHRLKPSYIIFFIQQEHILYPLTISEKTYVPNLHYPSNILCRKGTQCATL